MSRFILLFLLFAFTFFAPNQSRAETYCKHPNAGLFEEEGHTKYLNWEMTVIKSRTEGNKNNCFLEYIFSGGLNSPIEIVNKPKFNKAYIESWGKVIVVPEKVGIDSMLIKITYIKKNTGKITTGFVNYTLTIKNDPL